MTFYSDLTSTYFSILSIEQSTAFEFIRTVIALLSQMSAHLPHIRQSFLSITAFPSFIDMAFTKRVPDVHLPHPQQRSELKLISTPIIEVKPLLMFPGRYGDIFHNQQQGQQLQMDNKSSFGPVSNHILSIYFDQLYVPILFHCTY